MKSIIMAGGAGTRLYPLSRAEFPKQFVKFGGRKTSLFQDAIKRALKFAGAKDIYVLTVKDYAPIARLQALEADVSGINIIIEPQAKNTLPAIFNAVRIIRRGGDDTTVVMPSDHLINDDENLFEQIKAGEKLAGEYIFTFGIKPTSPETGYGYIRPGERLPSGVGGMKIAEFREKPPLEKALEYVKRGYLWNSGMFMFETGFFDAQVSRYSPEVYSAFRNVTDEECFERCPGVSIDCGLMEKTDSAAVLPLEIDWTDLGNFAAFYGAFPELADGNGNLIFKQPGKKYILDGVSDLVVVDAGDVVMIKRA